MLCTGCIFHVPSMDRSDAIDVNQSGNQPVHQSVRQPVRQPAVQSVSQSASQTTNQSFSQSIIRLHGIAGPHHGHFRELKLKG